MDALINFAGNVAILVSGLVVRFAVALALLAVLVALLLPFLYAGEGLRRGWRHLAGFENVSGLTWRRGLYYSPAHAWLAMRSGLVRLGLDDLAGRLLRQVDRVSLPAMGTQIRKGDPLLTLTAGRRGLVLPSPIDGIVARVNRRLDERPQSLVDDPYRRGWIVELTPVGDEFRTLPRDREAERWMKAEAARLSLALEHATGILAADGGEFTVPTHLLISPDQRASLEQQFLQATPAGEAAAS
jgi:glycine cleavage system H protein